jgi:hypothetical protein
VDFFQNIFQRNHIITKWPPNFGTWFFSHTNDFTIQRVFVYYGNSIRSFDDLKELRFLQYTVTTPCRSFKAISFPVFPEIVFLLRTEVPTEHFSSKSSNLPMQYGNNTTVIILTH